MANEFGTGFGQGLNYYTKFAQMQQNKLLDEERLKTERLRQEGYKLELDEKKDTRDVRMESIKSESEFQSARAKKYQTETDEFIANADQRRESSDLLLDTNKNNLNVSEFNAEKAKIELSDAKKVRAYTNLMNAFSVASDESLDSDVKASLIEDALIQTREYLDWTKFTEDSYWQGWEKITPQLEAGDFEGIARDHSDVLDVLYKESLESFKGKKFISKDGRKGEIQNVRLSGNFNPIENTANSLVGGTYSVLFEGQTEAEDVFTFMPDKSQYTTTIREDQEGTDAKVVSVADMVDKVSAEKDFAMYLTNNPETFSSFVKAAKGSAGLKGTSAEKKDKTKIYFELKDSAKTQFGTILKKATDYAADTYGGEPAYLESLYNDLPGKISTANIEKTVDEFGDPVYAYKSGRSAGTIESDFTREFMNPEMLTAEVESAYDAFTLYDKKLPGQKAIYTFGGLAKVQFDKTSSYLDATLEDTFGATKYNEYKEDAINFYPKAYPGKKLEDASDAQYLAFMEAFINRRISTGN